MIDVAMNTDAAALQGLAGRPIMSGLHASYSVGGLVGAGAGAAVAAANVAVGWHLAALAVVAFSCFLAEGAANDWSAVPSQRPSRKGARNESRGIPRAGAVGHVVRV